MLSEWYSEVRYRLRALVKRADMERELRAEIADHLEREADRLRSAGVAPSEARRRARLAFGGVEATKEATREARGVGAIDALSQCGYYALRSLRHRPGLVAAVSLTLALGLGANAAMFSVVDQLLLRPPAYLRDPAGVDAVYFAWQMRMKAPLLQGPHAHMPYTRFRDLTRWTNTLAQTATYVGGGRLVVGEGQGAREAAVTPVSATVFSFFNAPPVIGRYFTPAEDSAPEGTAVAVLGYGYWRSQYGGRSDVLGTPLRVGREVYTIIGVAPRGFVGFVDAAEPWEDRTTSDDEAPSVFVPITHFAATLGGWCGDYATSYCNAWVAMVVRRRPGVTRAIAEADLTAALQRSYVIQRAGDSARNWWDWKEHLPSLNIARPHVRTTSVLADRGPLESTTAHVATWIGGVAAIVLLIACANVVNLLLASAQERRPEIALRLALGVSRPRLIGQLLSEGVLLALIGGPASLFVARLLGAQLTSRFLPAGTDPSLLAQPRTIAFAAVATLLVGILIGLLPAAQVHRTDLIEALKRGGHAGLADRSALRSVMLFAQGALSVLLLVGAGLFVRSVQHVRHLRLGFDVEPVLYATINTRGVKLDTAAQNRLAARMVATAETLPGVLRAARTIGVPIMTPGSMDSVYVPGIGLVDRMGTFHCQAVAPGYFPTMGTHILRGRGFEPTDLPRGPRVTVVSDAMARLLWPGQDPIGKRIRFMSDTMPFFTVVGVSENTANYGLSDLQQPHFFIPVDQMPYDPGGVDLFIRVHGDATQYESRVQRALQSFMPGVAYVSVAPMQEILAPKMRSWQLGARLFLLFGGLALAVAAVGLYSVLAYDVARGAHEIGIRLALGARLRHVLQLVATGTALVAGAGMIVGAGAALLGGRWIAPLLFQESPHDPVVFGAAAVALSVAAIAAVLVPVVRASRLDPSTVLRSD